MAGMAVVAAPRYYETHLKEKQGTCHWGGQMCRLIHKSKIFFTFFEKNVLVYFLAQLDKKMSGAF